MQGDDFALHIFIFGRNISFRSSRIIKEGGVMKSSFARKKTLITNAVLLLVVCAVVTLGFYSGGISVAEVSPTAIYHGDRSGNCVSLMFNVYEGKDVVNGIIDVLEEKKVKATFFLGGCWADDNGETVCRIMHTGNELGNHGYFHKDHKKIGFADNMAEIGNTGKLIEGLCGYRPKLFAPPSGSFSSDTLKASEELGYSVIMWSKDTIDWRDKDERLVYKRATDGVVGGDLILMHPKKHTLAVLAEIIDKIVSEGFKIVTVGENVSA